MKGAQAKKDAQAAGGGAAPKEEGHLVPAKYLEREEYRDALEEVEKFLSFVFFRLDELNADLAVEGSHKEWADAQGAVVFLDELDYGDSDDPVLRDLAALHAQLKLVIDRLPIGPTGELKAPQVRLQ